ncbi:uncharacterized protein BYT42DRAFT_496220 [Radiomyces spectabilis]|uniref:uncharacterized protein n=1 Tax=Radiomyces spectabilis TaxID=64574 RepID=UPI00221FB166|nr:uncharacterized protein BYT42DRAFT_496220 [Radiomyces spectabilis]KAI8379172.1 hypothetical protein BYT42DRAFT_496220 [Radiomyces spectabilis]
MQYINDLFLQKQESRTVQVDKEKHIYRNRKAQDDLIHTAEKPADPNKPDSKPKKWSSYELEDYKWINYGEAKKLSDNIAAVFQEKKLQAGDRVLLYAKTRPEWMLTAMACCMLGLVITTAYDSMPPDAVQHIVTETEPKAIFTETSLMGNLNKAYTKLDKEKQPKLVLYTGEEFEAPDDLETFKKQKSKDVEMIHMHAIYEKDAKPSKTSTTKPDDLALIMYTSGTSGTPKGVELTNGNIIAAMAGAEDILQDFVDVENHSYIGFLPLAHVLEFIVEFIFITMGIPIGYGTARTLMDDSVCGRGGKGKGKGDLKALKPTIMAGVPAVWERIRNGVMKELDKQNWLVRQAFLALLQLKWLLLTFFGKENVITHIMDRTVFAPIRATTGGRLMYGLSGGAPLSYDTHKFVTSAVCFLLQGYGLTECCGLGAITVPALGMVTGVIGPPSPSIECRLVDVPETDYKAENGIGELWVRGPSLMRGYYKRSDLTKEAITEDGWFKTGDVARVKDDGTIAITDRAKNLVKLANGEYVALESLESKYRNNKNIKNICIIADSDKDHIVAVVEPNEKGADKDKLLKELQQTAKQNDCNRAETVQDILIKDDKDWQSTYLTTSGKLKRKDLHKDYKDDIEKINKPINDPPYMDRARLFLRRHPLIDTHNDLPMMLAFEENGKINHLDFNHLEGHTDIERLHRGHLTGQFWSIYYDCEDTSQNQVLKAMESIDVTKRMIALHPDTFQLVTSTKEFQDAYLHRRIGSMMGMEGGQMIDNSLAALRLFYDLGVRYMTPLFGKGKGLSTFGEKVVLEMNRLGMMVDISHVAHSTMHAVLNVTRAPVLFSHSSSHALCPIERNVPDEVLKRLDETDGVVQINFYNSFVRCDNPEEATLSDVADHIEHIASVAGRHRIGLGADYNGIEKTPVGLEDVSMYPSLFAELMRRGWTQRELAGLAGRNLLRVWKGVENVSKSLSNQLPDESKLSDPVYLVKSSV